MIKSKRAVSGALCILLVVALAVLAPVVKAADGGSLSFDDLIEAGKDPTEYTVTLSKTTALPGDEVTVTVAVTGGARSITHYVFYPVWRNDAFEVTAGQVIGMGLTADTGAVFQLNAGAIAVFSKAAVRTGELFSYTVRINDDAVLGSYNLTANVSAKRNTKEWNCILNDATLTVTDAASHVHSFTNYVSNNDATCTQNGTETATCDGCNATDTRTVADSALGHDYVRHVTPPTCRDIGFTIYDCTRCDENDYVAEEQPPVDHCFTEYFSNDDATCKADGTKTARCDYGCGTTDTLPDEGSMLPHSFNDYHYNNDATWEKDGTETATCDNEGCDATDTRTAEGTKLPHGWVEEEGDTWYYYYKGKMTTGWLAYGPVWYYFNEDGVMRTGFLYYGGQHYYFDTAVTNYGRMVVNKWIQDSGKWYYFDGNGYMVTGEYTINGEKNLFDENGVWQGVVTSHKNGWIKEDNKWYYYKNGAKTTGWLDLNGTWYYFKTSGEMVTGWLAYGPVWYYFNPDGDMRTGWLTYGGQHYYFDTAVTNYGRMVVNKWIQDAGKWYYFDGNGYRVTGSKTIGGKTYNFDENGVCLNP